MYPVPERTALLRPGRSLHILAGAPRILAGAPRILAGSRVQQGVLGTGLEENKQMGADD